MHCKILNVSGTLIHMAFFFCVYQTLVFLNFLFQPLPQFMQYPSLRNFFILWGAKTRRNTSWKKLKGKVIREIRTIQMIRAE